MKPQRVVRFNKILCYSGIAPQNMVANAAIFRGIRAARLFLREPRGARRRLPPPAGQDESQGGGCPGRETDLRALCARVETRNSRMSISTRIYTWLRGEFMGRDPFGNRYYRLRAGTRAGGRDRRWVIYSGEAEASKVPPAWHAWLHHTIDQPPSDAELAPYAWVKAHEPNPTGTDSAYRPQGHLLSGGRRVPGTGDYEPWRPS
jgi:NADH:ubiquinone oxidoreductase subunit